MKNYLKMTLVMGLALLSVLTIATVSAYYAPQYYSYSPAASAYAEISDTVSYSEDIKGENRGFNLKRTSTAPRSDVVRGCDYYDWTSNYRKCRRTAKYDNEYIDYYTYDDYDRYHYDNFRAYYDQDKALKEAFKTYQQSSKQQYQLESQYLSQRFNRRYGGRGYGYSGARFYARW